MAAELILAFAVVVFIFLLLYRKLWLDNERLRLQLQKLRFAKQSLSTKYGKMTEQFIPFLKIYPYNENNFRFLGTPVDGVQFEEDKIVFVEFKTANSKLSERQRKIKEMVEKKKVEFEEIRVS